MIRYRLDCTNCQESFDAWFADSATCDTQLEAGEVPCVSCGGTDLVKGLMAPRVGRAKGGAAGEPGGDRKVMVAKKAREAMLAVKQHIEDNCDYVGGQFAEEARKIHYGEAEERSIYGEASDEEHETLVEEGVDVHRVPWPVRTEH